jgi:ketosteroid isomerase-like protein
MASTNLDLVRSIFSAWGSGDFSSYEWAHPEIECVIADGPEPVSSTGLGGMAEGWRDFLSTWEEGYRTEADEYRELDGERVLVINTYIGRGKTSGLELGQIGTKGATLFHVHDDKVMRIVLYFDCEHVLADLGLAPDTGS